MAKEGDSLDNRSIWQMIITESPLPIIVFLLAVAVFIYVVEKQANKFYTQEVVVDITKAPSVVEENPLNRTEVNLPEPYQSLVKNDQWDRVLKLARQDTTLNKILRDNLIVMAYYNKGLFDSVVSFIESRSVDVSNLSPEMCLYYAFSLYQIDSEQGRQRITQCLNGTRNQRLYLRAASFLVDHFESDLARRILLKSDSFVTARWRPYWHHYMAMTYAIDGSRDSAIYHLEQTINYKPDWIKPRMKLAELLPNTEEGLKRKEELLLEVIRLRPTYAGAHYLLALVRQRMGKETGILANDTLLIAEDFSPEVLIQKIRAEISSGNYRLARRHIQDLLSINPENPYAMFLLANWYRAVDSLEQARHWYWKALRKANFRFPEAWLNLGITYRRLGYIDSAIYAYKQALQFRKDYHEALFNLAVAYWHADSIQNAHRIFKQLTELTPDHDRTWYFLGRTYERMGKTDSAVFAYRKALEINPSYRKALLRLAELDNSSETLAMLENYLRENPSDIKVLKLLGDLYAQRGEYTRSLKIYERVLQYDPDNVSVLRALARIYQRLGDGEKALHYWTEVLDRRPDSRVARRRLAELYLALGDTGKAIKHFEKLLRIEPERQETWERLIALYQQKGWVVRPTNRLASAWRDDLPQAGKLAYEIATFARKAEKYETARHFYQKALKKGYRKHWAAFWLGRIHLNQGDTTQALAYFNLAVREKEDFGLAWKRLAQLYLALDSLDRAQQALQKARELRPDDADLLELQKLLKSRVP